MKKRILSFITMLTLSSIFFTISAYANSTWKDSYMNFLLNKTFQECEGIPTISFADMDFDGVPELLYYDGGMLFGMGQRYSDVYSINSLGVVYKKGTVFSGATSASQAFLDKNTNQKKRLNFRGTSQVIYLSEMTREYDSTAIFSISEAFICDDNMYHWFENGKEVYKSSKYPTYEEVEMLLNDYKIIDDRTPEEQWKNFYSQSQKREIVDRMLSEFKSNSINVILNGTELTFDQPPILDPAGRVLVPIRKIAEAMGDDVKWNQDLQTAFVQHKERALIIPLYKDHLYTAYSDNPIEWRKYTLDVPSQVQNERTLTPVRAFCESLGATVNWDDSTQTVYIEYNGNYDYDSLSDETINGINMAYSIMRNHSNISFEKYSNEIYSYLENSNSIIDNAAMSWGSGLFDGIVQLISGENATETAVKASLAQVISLLDDINRSDDSAEVIDGIKFTKSGAEVVKELSALPKKDSQINSISDLNKLSETIPELKSLSKAIKATDIAVDILAFSAEQSSYLLADYAQNVAYLDNIEKYFRATNAGNDLLYEVIDDMREEYSSKWIHSLKSLRNEGIDKVLSSLTDKATCGVFSIVNFAKDLTNELTGLSTSAKGLKEFYALCILNVAFDEAYYEMIQNVSESNFRSDEMIDIYKIQKAVKTATYMSMNKIVNSVDEVSWDNRVYNLGNATYILWE